MGAPHRGSLTTTGVSAGPGLMLRQPNRKALTFDDNCKDLYSEKPSTRDTAQSIQLVFVTGRDSSYEKETCVVRDGSAMYRRMDAGRQRAAEIVIMRWYHSGNER